MEWLKKKIVDWLGVPKYVENYYVSYSTFTMVPNSMFEMTEVGRCIKQVVGEKEVV